MTLTPEELAPRQRRQLLLRALLRALTTTAVLLVIYYLLPMDTALAAHTVLLLSVCLATLAALATWQVRAIIRSEHPGIRAIETLAAAVPLYVLVFATTYFLIAQSAGNFTQPMTRTDALYFSVTVLTTVGFGDITAKSETARLLVTGQMYLDLIVIGLGVRVFLGAVRLGQQRHQPGQAA